MVDLERLSWLCANAVIRDRYPLAFKNGRPVWIA